MAAQRRSSKHKPPSMYDVARLAGVSQTTVSFVVNDVPKTNIAQETRDRVMAAVEELGWRPNALARGLRLQHSHTIGLISDEIASSPHAGKIIQGAQDAAWVGGRMLLIVNTGSNLDIERAALEMMLERQVEGLIYATMYHHAVSPAALAHVPAILLDCYVENCSLPSVVPDEVQGGRTATEVLLRKGHRRVGFINDVGPMPASWGRLDGYKQALAAYGVSFDPGLVRAGQPSNAAEGYRCALDLLRLPERPTALFCFNDSMAMGAYDAVKELGLAIPDDVAIVGFDNNELVAAQLHPPLTTMELPHYEMGQWAIRYLREHADSSDPEPVQHMVACRLIERASV